MTTTAGLSLEEALKIKTEALVTGINVQQFLNSGVHSSSFQPQIDAIYENDVTPLDHSKILPEVLSLKLTEPVGNTDNVYVKLRVNQDSPIRLELHEDGPYLVDETKRTPVGILGKPSFYGRVLPNSSDVVLESLVQRLGPDIVATTISNYCAYFVNPTQACQFCELVSTYKDHRNFSSVRKPLSLVLDAFEIAVSNDPAIKYILITSGTDNSKDHEPDYDGTFRDYIFLVKELRRRFPSHFIYAMPNPPRDFSLIDEIAEAAGDLRNFVLLFNIEVVDEDLAKVMTPGKYFHYGRDTLWRALEYGLSKGIIMESAFIFGLQSHHPLSPQPYDEERESDTVEAATRLIAGKGIIPTMSLYHASPKSRLGRIAFTPEGVYQGHVRYAQALLSSNVVDPLWWSPFGSQSSLTNKLDGNFYAWCKQQAQKQRG